VSQNVKVSFEEAKACYNLPKNRYSNKLASELQDMISFSPVCAPTILTISYIDDFTRVKLRSNGVEGSDYINANFINVSA